MQTEPEIGSPEMITLSWIAALVAYPAALMAAVIGQGLGALAGGCHWIGFNLAANRQVWALVNQPVLNFSSLPTATGYWLGSLLLPAILATALLPFLPRKRSLTAEMVLIQIAWAASIVGLAWLPLVDRVDGHLFRWLGLHGLPVESVWLAPLVGSLTGFFPTVRLLALARRRHRETRRLYRTTLVVVHFGLPSAMWAGAAVVIGKTVPLAAIAAITVPVCASIILAALRYPPAFAHRLSRPSRPALVVLTTVAILLAAVTGLTTRPRSDGRSLGLLWGTPQSFNNIRPWIDVIETESIGPQEVADEISK